MKEIVVSPFSNSDIRDWPAAHFAELIGLILDGGYDGRITVIGTKAQMQRACEIVRPFDATRVINDCGRRSWTEVAASLRLAACVIGNNSGVAHLSGFFGVPTVCIFGGSHQRREWRPLGPNVALVSRSIGCSPCHLDHGGACPYNKACLREIPPEVVARSVFAIMDRACRAVEVQRWREPTQLPRTQHYPGAG